VDAAGGRVVPMRGFAFAPGGDVPTDGDSGREGGGCASGGGNLAREGGSSEREGGSLARE